MEILTGFGIILVMILCSKFLRTLAFGRSDSIALEVAICSFLYDLVLAVKQSPDWAWFWREELMRCLVLLLFAFVIAAVHRHYKDLAMAKVDRQVDHLRTILHNGRTPGPGKRTVADTVLDNTGLLARASIDVWYSQFMDKLFFRLLKRTDKGDLKSFRKKKSLVRWAFADILNSLDITPEGEKKLNDRDLNIENRSQIIGMCIFDALEVASLLVALRIL